ncbi:MAG: hypothetical protein Q9201_007143 [Fulgogasparrea decipioides]
MRSDCKSILSKSYFTGGFRPIELPSWVLRIRNWQIEVFGGPKAPKRGTSPKRIDWWKDHFRDTCNFLARVTQLESLRVLFDCWTFNHSIDDSRRASSPTYLANPEAEEQEANKTTRFVEDCAKLQSLLRQLHVSKPIVLDIACGMAKCKKLVGLAKELTGANQPPIPRSEPEALFEACKHQLKSTEQTEEWYQPYKMMWLALDRAEDLERGDPLNSKSAWLAKFWSEYEKLAKFLILANPD